MIVGNNTSRIGSNVSSNGDTCTITVNGNFDFNQVKSFREAYTKLDPMPNAVVVDMRHANTIDSAALGMLINLKKHLGKADGEIAIQNCNPTVKKILAIARFDVLFRID